MLIRDSRFVHELAYPPLPSPLILILNTVPYNNHPSPSLSDRQSPFIPLDVILDLSTWSVFSPSFSSIQAFFSTPFKGAHLFCYRAKKVAGETRRDSLCGASPKFDRFSTLAHRAKHRFAPDFFPLSHRRRHFISRYPPYLFHPIFFRVILLLHRQFKLALRNYCTF